MVISKYLYILIIVICITGLSVNNIYFNRLSGSAAIKSKNVCLQLVDNHTTLTNSGIVQLFTQPHPQKIMPSPYWGKVPPRLRSSLLISKSKFFFYFIDFLVSSFIFIIAHTRAHIRVYTIIYYIL